MKAIVRVMTAPSRSSQWIGVLRQEQDNFTFVPSPLNDLMKSVGRSWEGNQVKVFRVHLDQEGASLQVESG